MSEEIKCSKDSLLNPKYGIAPRDLLMLVLELRNQFSVSLSERDVTEKRLDYMENLVDWIFSKTNG